MEEEIQLNAKLARGGILFGFVFLAGGTKDQEQEREAMDNLFHWSFLAFDGTARILSAPSKRILVRKRYTPVPDGPWKNLHT
jgi:hypothetical protein